MNNVIFDFLKDLKVNNTRDWFSENKDRYNEAREEFNKSISSLILALAEIDPIIKGVEVKETVFRIYRDVRFSKDKSPYKTAMGAYIAPGGRKSKYAGYYVHAEPGNSFLAGGAYCPQAAELSKIRSEIYYNAEEYKSILNTKEFKKLFKEVYGSKLVNGPKGFPKDFPDIDLIKYKDYTLVHNIGDDFFTNPKFITNSIKIFKEVKKYNDFINRAIDM